MLFVPESKKWLRGIFPAVFAIFIYLKVPIENQSPDCTHAFQMSETSSPRSRRSMQKSMNFSKRSRSLTSCRISLNSFSSLFSILFILSIMRLPEGGRDFWCGQCGAGLPICSYPARRRFPGPSDPRPCVFVCSPLTVFIIYHCATIFGKQCAYNYATIFVHFYRCVMSCSYVKVWMIKNGFIR